MSANLDRPPASPEENRTVADRDDAAPARSAVERAVRMARWLRDLSQRPALRPWLLGGAAVVFVAMAVSSFLSLPKGTAARPALVVVLVLITTPATLMLNALEYRFMAATLDHNVSMLSAVRVSLVASVANYLPAPGGVAVRTVALRRQGSTFGSAISVNILVGLVWAGLTGIVAGGALLVASELEGRGVAAVTLGAVLLVVAAVLLRRSGSGWVKAGLQVGAIELAMVCVSGLRIWVALVAIGQTAPLGAAVAMSSSAVLASLLGVFPAGLGLREGLAAGIASIVTVSQAAAIAATAIDRVAGQVGLAIAAMATGVRWSDLSGRKPQTTDVQ